MDAAGLTVAVVSILASIVSAATGVALLQIARMGKKE